MRKIIWVSPQELKAKCTIAFQRLWNPVSVPSESLFYIVHSVECILRDAGAPLRVFCLIDCLHISTKLSAHLGASQLLKPLQYIPQPFLHRVLRLRHH